jgi:hypothetical protein
MLIPYLRIMDFNVLTDKMGSYFFNYRSHEDVIVNSPLVYPVEGVLYFSAVLSIFEDYLFSDSITKEVQVVDRLRERVSFTIKLRPFKSKSYPIGFIFEFDSIVEDDLKADLFLLTHFGVIEIVCVEV